MEPHILSTLVYQYYDCPLQVMWNAISDVSKSFFLLHHNKKPVHSEPIFRVNHSSTEQGSIFSFVFLSTLLINFKVEKYIETDYWCHFQWKAYMTTLFSPLFQVQVSLFPITESKTLLSLYFTKCIKYQFYFDQIIYKFNIFNSIGKILDSNEQYKVHIGNIGIKCPFGFVANQLSDWKTYQKNVGLLCDEVEYEGNELKEGTVIIIKFNRHHSPNHNHDDSHSHSQSHNHSNGNGNSKMAVITLKVISILMTDTYFLLRIQTVDHKEKGIPFQEIDHTVWKVNEEESYFIIKHKFKKVVPQKVLIYYTNQKEKLLRQTKRWCEKVSFVFD